jgi:hypothetical protein
MSDKKIAPRDALLRHMYRGVIALHSGEHEAGTRSLDRAWTVAEDRFTKSVSRGALSMVTAEAALPYGPGITERMLIPYYGGLNWLARLPERVVLVTAAADRAHGAAVCVDEHLGADALRGGSGRRDDGHEGHFFAALERGGQRGEHFLVHRSDYRACRPIRW